MDERGLQAAFFCAPVLTYEDVCCAPVLENHAFRHTLIHSMRSALGKESGGQECKSETGWLGAVFQCILAA